MQTESPAVFKPPALITRRGLVLFAAASLAGVALASLTGCRVGRRAAGSAYRMSERERRRQQRAVPYTVKPMPESFYKEMDAHWANWLKHTKRLKLDNDTTRNVAAVDVFLKACKNDSDILTKPQPGDVVDAAGTALGAGLLHRAGMKWGVLKVKYDPDEIYVLTDKAERVLVSPWSLTDAVFNGNAEETIAQTTKKIEAAIGKPEVVCFPEDS